MQGVHVGARTLPPSLGGGGPAFTDQANAGARVTVFLKTLSCCSSSSSPSSLSLQLGLKKHRKSNHRLMRSIRISCKSSQGDSIRRSNHRDDDDRGDDEYLEAFVMISETIRHHQLRTQGFIEEKLFPFSIQSKKSRAGVTSFGHGILRRFQSPTIFLKIACDGDLFLPIIVGEFAIEKLIDAFREDEDRDRPNHFQLVKNLVEKLEYEVEMVRITERVGNTYIARIYFKKSGEKASLSVDARPSDAINIAKRCKVPIYVNKQIILTDAINIAYGTRRERHSKSTYDVSLDSAAEGPDLISEELDMITKLNIAVREERYEDAAIWRDKLTKFRTSSNKV